LEYFFKLLRFALGLFGDFYELLHFALALRSDDDTPSPHLFVAAIMAYHLLSLAWNLRSVLRFLLRVGFYGAIPMGIGAVLYLVGEIRP
jgi:hypothetical protein